MVSNSYYFAKFHSAGIVTEIQKNDDWLDQEMGWVSRSEIPFITAFRHSQIKEQHLVSDPCLPIIRSYRPFFKVKYVDEFPSKNDCMQLVYKYCEYATDKPYRFSEDKLKSASIIRLYTLFDEKNDLLVRAGSCLYKAYILFHTSHTFAEEIYINAFIAFEAIVEYLISKNKLTGKDARNAAIDIIGAYIEIDNPGIDFKDYENEMRDGIRNDIIHPFRRNYDETIAQPFLMANYIFEDLGFIDWIFKKVIEGKLA